MSFIADEFVKDFLAEADEHLASIHLNLFALESSTPGPERAAVLNALFRSFHTIKGLSGMIELMSAASLSHVMESILIKMGRAEIAVDADAVNRLMAGTQALGEFIQTLRGGAEPIQTDVLGRLQELADGVASSAMPSPGMADVAPTLPLALASHMTVQDVQALADARRRGAAIFMATWTPSPQLAEAGINVSSVRDRLSATADILKVVPFMEGRQVRFAFLVAGREASVAGVDWHVIAAADSSSGDPAPLKRSDMDAVPPKLIEPGAFHSVRVDVARMDDLVRLVGDLVVTRSRLDTLIGVLPPLPGGLREGLRETAASMQRQLRDLRETVIRLRMVPLAEVFNRMPLAVRDLARLMQREAHLELRGQETQIDKMLVERLLDPLMHLVRNALAHGIEPSHERVATGKPAAGRLVLAAYPEADAIVVTLSDDGRGVQADEVAVRARKLGWLPPQGSVAASELLDFLCRPGFSTRSSADLGAGRGVGLDVVQQAVHAVGGTLSMQTVPGQGTTFTLRLPLTLAIVDAFLVTIGEERFAVPRSAVEAAVEIDPHLVLDTPGGPVIPFRDGVAALLPLAEIFGGSLQDAGRYALIHQTPAGPRTALAVTRITGLREVVVRTITDPLVARPGIAGATELGDGRVALILDVAGLVRMHRARGRHLVHTA